MNQIQIETFNELSHCEQQSHMMTTTFHCLYMPTSITFTLCIWHVLLYRATYSSFKKCISYVFPGNQTHHLEVLTHLLWILVP